jgi:hypothetical protein
VEFAPGSDVIAFEADAGDPDVSVVFFYPVLRPPVEKPSAGDGERSY